MISEAVVVAMKPANPIGLYIVTEHGELIRLPRSPTTWEYKQNHRWGTIDRTGRKAVARRAGEGLATLDFSINVFATDPTHPHAGATVELATLPLMGWAAKGTVLRIKNGSAAYQAGNWWYVKDSSLSVNRVNRHGLPLQTTISFSLEEYVNHTSTVIKPPPPPPAPPPPPQTPLPQPTPVEQPVYRYHTVCRGDTLWKLASRYLGSAYKWKRIYFLNKSIIGRNPHYLKIGLRLKIPPRDSGYEGDRDWDDRHDHHHHHRRYWDD